MMQEDQDAVLKESDWYHYLPALVRVTLAREAVAYQEGQADALKDRLDRAESGMELQKVVDAQATVIELLTERFEIVHGVSVTHRMDFPSHTAWM